MRYASVSVKFPIEIDTELAALGETVDADDLGRAVEEARAETSDQVYGSDS